jgi:hypothetical protein
VKSCPTCSRTYGDDTLVFCLDDGAHLSTPYDPRTTLKGSAARDTRPPRTEILPSDFERNEARPGPVTEKRGGTFWLILTGTLVLMVVGLVTVVAYLTWKGTSKSTPERSTLSATPRQSNDVPRDANRAAESSPPSLDAHWLDGVWEGEGYQSDTKTTWAVRLTVQDGTYAIDYPNIPCRGRWTLIDKNSREASFTEVITQGTNLCDNNSHVLIEKMNESEISCRYTHASSRVVIATATLSKKSPG